MLFIISCPHLFNHLLKMKASEQYFHVVLFHLQSNGILNLIMYAYSLYCSLHISQEADKENLFSSQELLHW